MDLCGQEVGIFELDDDVVWDIGCVGVEDDLVTNEAKAFDSNFGAAYLKLLFELGGVGVITEVCVNCEENHYVIRQHNNL